ncbi:uncharacterized protein M6B38_143755 [Iris pallida]|uniref:rRNA N-glycosylase n=1 Tax=Iris pallida TaxID=29817 RepID=A0AAX6FB00_IRIPA|nr:uncharacterized protein M6B38_143755 [Iris pallida]
MLTLNIFIKIVQRVNMKMWLVLAITCVWWAAIVGPAVWGCSSSLSVTGGGYNNAPSYDTVEFRAMGCTKKTYSTFLKSLRARLSSGTSVHNIPVLPAQSGSQQDLLLVKLFDWDDEPITLVLNRINAYVIAYQAKSIYYLLADTPNNAQLYGSNPYRFTFTGSYTDLQRVAKDNRENIDLGITALAQAVDTLYYWSPTQSDQTSVARSLIVLIQSVSETARFRRIEQRFTNNIIDTGTTIRYENFRPGVGVINLETNWETLSTAVQQSKGGVFLQPIKLKVNSTTTIDIKDANSARIDCGLALLLYWRQSQASLSPRDSSVFSTSVDLNVRSMLDIAA